MEFFGSDRKLFCSSNFTFFKAEVRSSFIATMNPHGDAKITPVCVPGDRGYKLTYSGVAWNRRVTMFGLWRRSIW